MSGEKTLKKKMQTAMQLTNAMQLALDEASLWVGATAPNPPVGAVALDQQGRVLAKAAHERAGTSHAEARVI